MKSKSTFRSFARSSQSRATATNIQECAPEPGEFLENAVIPMHWLATDGTILWANQAELALLGYRHDEYVRRNLSSFLADPMMIWDILQRVNRDEELHDYEVRLRCKNGSVRNVHLYSSALTHNQSSPSYSHCFVVDIIGQKETEQESQLLAAIVQSSDDAIASKDLNGIVTSWNKAAERMFGYKAEEIIGRPITTIIPAELHDDEPEILARIIAGQRIVHFETARITKAGERLNVSLTISPIKDKDGKIIGAAKIVRDVTAHKKLEAALHVSERLASVGRLAATVAHEINNPLEAVTNFIYLARHQPGLPEKVTRYLTAADQELRRVAHIAQQTLGFYRDNSRPATFALAKVVDDVLALYERKFKYKSLKLEKRIEPNLKIYGLEGELKQVLSNLIANASDASREGGRMIISARLSRHLRSGKGVIISVADTGTGIAPEDKRKLFTPFFTSKQDVGTGLGLWITKDLLEKKGGRIRFRSRDTEPSGTVMTIFLPLQQPSEPEKRSILQ